MVRWHKEEETEMNTKANLDVKLDGNLNKFYQDARDDITKLIGGAAIKAAVIFNNSPNPVTFFVYNYSDGINLVPAQKVLVAPGHQGIVAASGVYFKIHPNNNRKAEFLVEPKQAYVFHGYGKVEPVAS